MPLIQNPKHEQFAQNKANGMAVLDAYMAAGYPCSQSSAACPTPCIRFTGAGPFEIRKVGGPSEFETDRFPSKFE